MSKRRHDRFQWKFSTATPSGQRIGTGPLFTLPDERVVLLAKNYDLRNKTILEPGCLEGANTISLWGYSPLLVCSYDPHECNVELTKLRLLNYDLRNDWIFKDDSIASIVDTTLGPDPIDLIFHTGLLYHLAQPVREIRQASKVSKSIFIQTHYAVEEGQYVSTGNWEEHEYEGFSYFGRKNPDASGTDFVGGLEPFSFWLSLPSLIRALTMYGYSNIKILKLDTEHCSVSLLAQQESK